MGSSGMKRRGRPHVPKVSGDVPRLGAPDAPWGPLGNLDAIGRMARAAKSDDPRQRRRGIVMVLAVCLGPIVMVVLTIVALVNRS